MLSARLILGVLGMLGVCAMSSGVWSQTSAQGKRIVIAASEALDGNPLKDIAAVRRVAFVMQAGIVYMNIARSSSARAFENAVREQRAAAPAKLVSFPTQDGGLIYANLYGKGSRGVVLAHGGRFNKESWESQAQALVGAGFRVLAIDFRGRGQSKGPGASDILSAPLHYDVLAAIRYLRKTGARTISLVGGSLGGAAAGDAAREAQAGEIDRIVFLGSTTSLTDRPPEQVKGRKLFILTRDDYSGDAKIPRLPKIRGEYEKTAGPKEMVILDGSAHAQFIFQTDQGERLMREILRFLTAP